MVASSNPCVVIWDPQAELDNLGRSESHLTSVSEGSIGAAEASEIEDKPKEDANEQSEDATTFVVRVGETEDDLDYDIKDTLASADEHQMETKTPTAKNVDRLVCLKLRLPPR